MAPRHSLWQRLRWEGLTGANQPAVMARIAAYLYLSGALIVLASLLLPANPERDDRFLALAVALALAAVLFILALFDRIPLWGFNLMSAFGSALISLVMYESGTSSGTFFRPIFFWVVLYAAYFFTTWQLAAQVLWIGLLYAVVLDFHQEQGGSALDWFVFCSSLAVTALLVYVLRDRLQQMLAREQAHVRDLERLDEAKDEIIAVVSHELRTPLASVYGAALTLERPGLAEARKQELLAVVGRESERLANLIDSVLWTSRIDSDAVEVDLEPVDAREVVAEVVAAASSHAPDDLDFDVVAPPKTPQVLADREKLVQVLAALVENAVKYSPEGGRVIVELAKEGSRLRLSVHDRGFGIPREQQERIFEKFHRVDPQMLQGVGGTGLGLYIARDLVERMDGHLLVTSQVGQGSTFSFSLPLA